MGAIDSDPLQGTADRPDEHAPGYKVILDAGGYVAVGSGGA